MPSLTVAYLRKHSGLPGPRGNLELLHRFAGECETGIVDECLAVIRPDTANSPDEFVGMCGVLGRALLVWKDRPALIAHLKTHAVHPSWRIREAVAIALQEIPVASLAERLRITAAMESGDALIHRAIVAGLCEPKNLRDLDAMAGVFAHLSRATRLLEHNRSLDEGEEALRKALGYGWSVAIVASPAQGKAGFEHLLRSNSRHLRWIAKENLKKNRLSKLDPEWVGACVRTLGEG